MAGLCAPLSTLRQYPHGYLRMTRGRCGSLLLHRDGLAPSTPCRSPGALRSTPVNGHSQDRPVCLKGATKRHRACTPLANFLSEDLAFTRKVKVNTTFLVRERHGRLSTPCLRT